MTFTCDKCGKEFPRSADYSIDIWTGVFKPIYRKDYCTECFGYLWNELQQKQVIKIEKEVASH